MLTPAITDETQTTRSPKQLASSREQEREDIIGTRIDIPDIGDRVVDGDTGDVVNSNEDVVYTNARTHVSWPPLR